MNKFRRHDVFFLMTSTVHVPVNGQNKRNKSASGRLSSGFRFRVIDCFTNQLHIYFFFIKKQK